MKTGGWEIWKLLGKWLFAALFIGGGVGHFAATDFYVKIMPPYLPLHRALVIVSGVIEIALGVLLLIPRFSRLAAWGIIALLIAIFPANVHVYMNQERFPLPPIVHLLRLPLQGVLILWAFSISTGPPLRTRAGTPPAGAGRTGG